MFMFRAMNWNDVSSGPRHYLFLSEYRIACRGLCLHLHTSKLHSTARKRNGRDNSSDYSCSEHEFRPTHSQAETSIESVFSTLEQANFFALEFFEKHCSHELT
jgi:hypothetical protein